MRLLALSVAAALTVACSSKPETETNRAPADPSGSRITLRAGSVAADGTTPALVIVTVRDGNGAPIAGAPVSLGYAGTATVTAIRPSTDASGTAVFSLTSATPSVGAVTATVDATALTDDPTLIFHACEHGTFVNGACVPPPFVLLAPAVPASWGGVKPTYFAVGDLDGNALDDVVVADPDGKEVQVLVSTGDGKLAPRARFDAGGSVYGVVVADVTGDAIADVVTVLSAGTLGPRLAVLPGTGDGTLQAAVTASISEYANVEGAADLDADGDVDLVARASGGVGVLLNQGNGTFGALTKYTSGSWTPGSIAVADVDGDGKADVVGAYASSNEVEVRLGSGDGTLGASARYATGVTPEAIAVGDVDGDGDLDLVTANYGASWYDPFDVSVLLGSGDGTFGAHAEYEAGLSSQSVALADLDGDGMADVVTADRNGASVSVLRATGGGALARPVLYESTGIPWRVAIARVDADATADLVVLDYASGTLSTALGAGDGTFAAPRKPPYVRYPSTLAAGDVTGDGRVDLVADAGTTQDIAVAVGLGDGTFSHSFSVAVPGDPSNGRIVTVGDLDGAGGADVVVVNKNTQEISVLLSSGGALVLDATYAVSGRTEAVAIGDLNEDGRSDVVVVSPVDTLTPGRISVFLGAGGGALGAETVQTVGGYPWAVALGDLNGDAHVDAVLTATYPTELRVLLGDGSGGFAAAVQYPGATVSGTHYGEESVALADLDHDGDLDAVATDGTNFAQAFANDGTGAFGIPDVYALGAAPCGLALGDVNGDGDVDAVSADRDSQSITFLGGLGDGTFAEGITYSGYSSPQRTLVTNLNGDGYGDVVVANWGTSTLPVTLGSATGIQGWTPIAMGDRPSDLAVADLDADGAPDLVAIAYERAGLTVAMGSGAGTWRRPVTRTIGGYPASISVLDVSGDGRLDAIVTHIAFLTPTGEVIVPGGLGVLLGNGDGTFGPETLYPAGHEPRRVALGDVNGDGRVDAVVPSATSAQLLTQNADGSFAAPVALPTAPSPEELASPEPGIIPPSDLPYCSDVALADLNGDGRLDLVAANAAPYSTTGAIPINEAAVLLGNGDGTFQPRTAWDTVIPVNILVADLDVDGDLDVAVATNWSTLSMMTGDGLGGFTVTDLPLAVDGIAIATGDLDLDGLPDLVTSNGSRAFAAHRNAGPAFESFTFAINDPIRDLEVADLDGDGRPDVAALTVGGLFPLFTRLP